MQIEEFLGNDLENNDWLEGKKLTDEERNSLEMEVSLDEIKKALDGSNFESSSGWDGNLSKLYVSCAMC